jgi:hypothetical protein
MSENEREREHIDLPKDGSVSIVGNPTVTEKEIADDLEWITIQLDGIYNRLTDAMQPFQLKWLADPKFALAEAAWDGATEGGGAWVEDLGDLFDGETWEKMGKWISDLGAEAADGLAGYAKERAKRLAELLEKPERTIFSWSWWLKQAEEEVVEAQQNVKKVKQTVVDAAEAANDAVKKAKVIWNHREEICQLPELIARGDVKGVERFVDTVVRKFDPKLANEIMASKDFYAVLQFISDPDGALTYITYVQLTLEAIPPNFYVYIGGKAGMYVLCEVILLIVTALLSAGAATAARLASLTARIAANSARVAKVTKKIENAANAIQAFKEVIERFVSVAGDLRALGKKMNSARQRIKKSGNSREALQLKRNTTRRDRKCRICDSTKHKTPAHPPVGCLDYE